MCGYNQYNEYNLEAEELFGNTTRNEFEAIVIHQSKHVPALVA